MTKLIRTGDRWLIEQARGLMEKVRRGNNDAATLVADSHRLIEQTKAKISSASHQVKQGRDDDGAFDK